MSSFFSVILQALYLYVWNISMYLKNVVKTLIRMSEYRKNILLVEPG